MEVSFAFTVIVVHGIAAWENHVRPGIVPYLPKWFDETFGIPSPTSGTTRAILALNRGDLREALLYNPVAALVAAFGVGFVIYLAVSALTRRRLVPSRRLERLTFWVAMSALFLTWIAKLIWVPESYW